MNLVVFHECVFILDTPTFFVGGPIWALAWLPIPSVMGLSKNVSQYIAVSTHPTMDIEYSVTSAYAGKNIIQIWNLGSLNHECVFFENSLNSSLFHY